MIVAEAKVEQTLCNVRVYVEFGKGKVSVGVSKRQHDGENFYCLSIREMEDASEPGTLVDRQTVKFSNENEMILSFPTENQMIAVLAAFTNQSFEVVDNKWKAAQAKDEAVKEVQ